MKNEEYWQGYTDACKEICYMITDKQDKIRKLSKQKFDELYFSGDKIIYFLKLMIGEIVEHRKAKMKEDGDANG